MNLSKIKKKVIKKQSKRLSLNQINEIKETFEILDENKCNKILVQDLKTGMLALGLKPTIEEFERIKKQIGNQNEIKETISFQEFYEIVAFRLCNKDNITDYKYLYTLMSDESQFKITKDSIRQIAEKFNEILSEEELEELINAGDYDQDDVIGEEDFYKILKKTNY